MNFKYASTIFNSIIFAFFSLNLTGYFFLHFYTSVGIIFYQGLINTLLLGLLLLLFLYWNISIYKSFLHKLLFSFLIILFSFGTFSFHQQRLEGGHDEGAYLGYAARISNTGSLQPTDESTVTMFSYFYEKGEIRFQTEAFWSYILGSFYSVFGLLGFSFCIFFTAIAGVLSISFISRYFFGAQSKNLLVFLTLFLFSYYTIYFTTSAYIENILFLQAWLIVFLFVTYYHYRNKLYLGLSFFYSCTIFLTRPEGIFYFISFFLALIFLFYKSQKISRGIFILVLLLVTLFGFFVDKYFFNSLIFNGVSNIGESYFSYNFRYTEFSVLGIMLLFTLNSQVMSLSFLGYISIFKQRQKKIILLIFILLLPQVLFLVLPNIKLLLPWAFRRFWSGIFVAGLFLFSLTPGAKFFVNKIIIIFIVALSIFNGGRIYGLFANESYYETMSEMNSYITDNFSQNGLLAVDWTANYLTVLSDYFGKSLIVDTPPLKSRDKYEYFFRNNDKILIFSAAKDENKIISLFKKSLSIEINKDDIVLRKVYFFQVNQIKSFFDINIFFSNRRDFPGYNNLLQEGAMLSESTPSSSSLGVYIYELDKKNYFIPSGYDSGAEDFYYDELTEKDIKSMSRGQLRT